MSIKLLIQKLYYINKRYITREEIIVYCRELKLNYYVVIRYLTFHKYLVRIFKGIFYVKSVEERKFNKIGDSYLKIIHEALMIKGVKNYYFGLSTAIKLNGLTHEFFTLDYVISDKIFRKNPITILGYKVAFIKIVPRLFSFGIVTREGIFFSDLEKTYLDLVYLGRYGQYDAPPKELIEKLSKKRLLSYSRNYNKTIDGIAKGIK
jgi:hypothetical protein